MAPISAVTHMTSRANRVPCVCFMLLCCIPLHGLDRDRKLDQLYHTAWTFKDGAPSDVHALAQTTDGYLWLGSASGLFRFDGIQFQRYQPLGGQNFRQQSVYSLFATPDGGLWVGYWNGGVSFIKGGEVVNYGEHEGLPSRAVLSFAVDSRGTVWIAAGSEGVARLEGTRWRRIGADWGLTEYANTVFVDHTGTVWVGTASRVQYLTENGTHFQTAAENLKFVTKFAESPDGTLWMAETGRAVRPVPLIGKRNSTAAPEIVIGSQAIAIDNQGSLWIATIGDGIIRIPFPEQLGPRKVEKSEAGLERRTQQTDLTSDYLYAVLQDHEGNIWFGSSGGLDQFRQGAVVFHPLPGGTAVGALVPDKQGSLWVATIGSSYLTELRGDEAIFQLVGPYVDCAYRDPQGVIWLDALDYIVRIENDRMNSGHSNLTGATYQYREGIQHRSYHGDVHELARFRRLEFPDRSSVGVTGQSIVRGMTSDESGRLWISMQSGTFRLEKSGWTSLETLGGPRGTAKSEFTDSQGRVWFGFVNMIAVLEKGKITIFSVGDGVQVGAVTAIQEENSRIWIGGESGLQYLEGNRFQSIEPTEGGTIGDVLGIVVNPGQGLWLATNQGITYIAQSELQRLRVDNQKVALRTFGLLDGLTSALHGELTFPPAARTSDGRIWFATTKGLVWIDPHRIPNNKVPPPVAIESLVADSKRYDTSTSLKLPAKTRNLQIAYTATSLTIPVRVRFRYKLDGQDRGWQEPGTRREAAYTNLSPGSYHFHVVACNNDGVWNETGATFDFTIEPAWFQTVWFRAFCIGVFAAMVWGIYHLRVRQLQRKFASMVDVRVNERTRIARELHDTVLQSLHGLLMSFQRAANLLPERPVEAKQRLESAIDQAAHAITEGRDAVQGLRSSTGVTNDLALAIQTLGEELAAKQTTQNPTLFNVAVEGTLRDLNPILRDDVYRIAGEALRNAFHHAEARRIEVDIHYDERELRLRVRDDGKGISTQLLSNEGRPGHWGLEGMRERAKLVGGHLEIWSKLESGTEIELRVPASTAYLNSNRGKGRHLKYE
jgi:signal transduction histidine kinase/ligand-binding sensor domain-containing protein